LGGVADPLNMSEWRQYRCITYARLKNALQAISRSATIEEARTIAEHALHRAVSKDRPLCANCRKHKSGFMVSPQSRFCSEQCRDMYLRKKDINPRWARALEMREAGMTYTAIGRALGVCNETARKLVNLAVGVKD
jgi:hypothetical protein